MKQMLLGIFLMTLANWLFQFGAADNFAPVLWLSLLLIPFAIGLVLLGLFKKD